MTTKPGQNSSPNPAAGPQPSATGNVQVSGNIMIGLSLDGTITHSNDAACEAYRLDAHQVIGRPYSDLIPADRRDEQEQILTLLRGGQGAKVPQTVRSRSNRELFAVAVNAVPVIDTTGQPHGGVVIETDITERLQTESDIRRVNEMLIHLNARLSQAFKDNESFSYSVSHDLREPLRAINGFSQALDEDYRGQLDQQGQHYLDRIRSAGERMARLIDDILRLSRLSRQDLVLRPLDIAELARLIIDRLHQEQPEREVELVICDHMPAIADRRLLSIALENLLRNAWKFTSHADSPTIELGVTRQHDQTIYYIADNGCGLHPDQAEEIFLPFRRGKQADNYTGSGIGLAVVKRIIERHQGRIWCQSKLHEGTTFYFTLDIRE